MRRLFSLAAIVLLVLGFSAVTANADSPDLTWRQDHPRPLLGSRTHFEHGIPQPGGGCAFNLDSQGTAAATSYLVRQLAVDFKRCIALTEEGVPGPDFVHPSAANVQSAPATRKNAASSGLGGRLASPSHQNYTNTGYTQFTLVNGWYALLSRTTVSITWTTDLSYVSSVSGSGTFYWGDSWAYDGGGYYTTAIESCGQAVTCGFVRVYGTFHGTINTSCYHRYLPAPAQGWYDTNIGYGPWQITYNCYATFLQGFKQAGVVG